jgi:hypothetical protein
MNHLPSISSQEAIIETIHQMNLHWLEGSIEDISEMLDEEIVMYLPRGQVRVVGRKDFVAALQHVRKNLNITRCDELDYSVRTCDGISIAHYTSKIDYEMPGGTRSESGIDFLVFVDKEGSWRLIRRSVIVSE